MNDDTLQVDLSEAYPAAPLSEERMSAIGRQVRLASVRRRTRRKLWLGAGALFAVAATAGFTYPIAAANLLGQEVERNMRAAGPYLVRISVRSNDAPGAEWSSVPIELISDGDDEYIPHLAPGSKTFAFIDSKHQMHVCHPASKIDIVYPADPNVDSFYRLPLLVMEHLDKLGVFDMSKRIESRGERIINGRKVREIAMKRSGKEDFVADLDEEKDVLLSMTIGSISTHAKGLPSLNTGMRFDYSYGDPQSKQTIAELKPSVGLMKELGLDRDRQRIRDDLFAKPLSVTPTGRDQLKVYQVQEDPAGDVFVLYSCRGYHSVEDNVGTWLQLKDGHGRAWITSLIDMNFSGLAPKGEGLKAQIFYHPDAPNSVGTAHLSIRLNDWEYLRSDEPSTRATREIGLGAFAPSKVDCVPIWFFYAFGTQDEAWVPAMGQKLRFQQALAAKQYNVAIRLGQDFDGWFPEHMTELWFSRADLYRCLADAFRRVGDEVSARRYHDRSEALYKADPYGGDLVYQNKRASQR